VAEEVPIVLRTRPDLAFLCNCTQINQAFRSLRCAANSSICMDPDRTSTTTHHLVRNY
jgi:hypothetical protein